MSADVTPDVIGSWAFHVESGHLVDGDELRQVAAAVSVAAAVLARAGLLRPRELSCTEWLGYADSVLAAADVPPLLVADPPIDDADVLESLLRRHTASADCVSAFPRLTRLRGSGDVVGADGSTIPWDAFALEVIYDGVGVTVSLDTYLDVWMPFDLAGRAQTAVAERSAPRLAALIRDLSAALLVDVDPEGTTKFARSVASGLENRRDVDGTVIDTTE